MEGTLRGTAALEPAAAVPIPFPHGLASRHDQAGGEHSEASVHSRKD